MTQASTSRAQLFYTAETNGWGGALASPKMKALRFTGETFRHSKTTAQSAEINATGEVPDVPEIGASAVGGFTFELSFGAYDDWFAMLLHGVWVDADNTASVTVDDTNKSYAGTGIATNIVVGQHVRVTGCTTPGNNGFKTVTARPSADEFRVAETCTDEGPTASVNVEGSRLRNGTIEQSMLVEKLLSDLAAGQYHSFAGVEAATMQMEMVADAFIRGSFGVIGKEGIEADATVGDGDPDDAPTNDVMNAQSNIGQILEGYASLAALTDEIQGLRFNVNGNLAGRRAIKRRTAIGIRQGRLVVTGNINAYYERAYLLTKCRQHTASALQVWVHDDPDAPTTSNTYIFTWPRIRILDGGPTAPAADQDVFADFQWQAVRDPVLACTMQIERFAAVP
jgi:hypothetical protein